MPDVFLFRKNAGFKALLSVLLYTEGITVRADSAVKKQQFIAENQ